MDNANATSRLFLALWPSPEVQFALRAWRDCWVWPQGATPVSTERLHVTLHFLGQVARGRVPELMQGLSVPARPFELEFGHAELWPRGIAVLSPESVPGPLAELQAALGEAVARLGLTPETRAYRPHVTLARRAGSAAVPQGPPIRWQVTDYSLMESTLGPGGGYTVLRRYPFDSANPPASPLA